MKVPVNILELKDSLGRLSRLSVASTTARQNHLRFAPLRRKSDRDSAARRLKRRHALQFLLDPVFSSVHLANDISVFVSAIRHESFRWMKVSVNIFGKTKLM
jgi:hypothetical protein